METRPRSGGGARAHSRQIGKFGGRTRIRTGAVEAVEASGGGGCGGPAVSQGMMSLELFRPVDLTAVPPQEMGIGSWEPNAVTKDRILGPRSPNPNFFLQPARPPNLACGGIEGGRSGVEM